MSRIKGGAKGGSVEHGAVSPVVFEFLEKVSFLTPARKLAARAKAANHANSLLLDEQARNTETQIADSILAALKRNDAGFFFEIGKRISAGCYELPIDPEGFAICEYWSIETHTGVYGCFLKMFPHLENKKPKRNIRFPDLLRHMEATFPGKRFSVKSLRKKARSLGVKFGPAGRPRIYPQ